ncbi:uncharacterized protein N7503_001256 [Penicillium pulvis]|uniref:uncharacterized protein n=1 Tax=Penicillium pulvis TaxID=1562058 RepID=UPI00254729B8|nr:uncharacterized protein N7503_001256 [Penicillium pulvis]KAJ5809038.1 hypothetical protein N7503_001256 [Penicillium pulvis]
MEFDNLAVTNQAIDQGLYWNSEVHSVVFFCRDGRVKLCRKCQKPGHVQSHCPHKSFICGHCADEHPTWECPSTRGGMIRIKCANCSGNHRPTSLDCPVKREAKAKAEQIRAECPPYHRVPLHLRTPRAPAPAPALAPAPARASAPAPALAPARAPEFNSTSQAGLKDSVHAPANRFDFQFSQSASQRTIPLASQHTAPPASQPVAQKARGRPKGSKNKSKTSTFSDKSLPTQPELTQNTLAISKRARNSRSQQQALPDPISDPERLLQHKKRRFKEPQIDIENDQVMRARSPSPAPAPAPANPAMQLLQSAREQLSIQDPPARGQHTRLRILPPHPPAPAPTEETLPLSHGLHFSDIFDGDIFHVGSSPPEPEEEFFHEASEYSDDHDDHLSSNE